MKDLRENLISQLNESRNLWAIEYSEKGVRTGKYYAVCSSEKAARVWLVENEATWPAWHNEYKNGKIVGAWTAKGEKLTIVPCEIYTQEKTEMSPYLE